MSWSPQSRSDWDFHVEAHDLGVLTAMSPDRDTVRNTENVIKSAMALLGLDEEVVRLESVTFTNSHKR